MPRITLRPAPEITIDIQPAPITIVTEGSNISLLFVTASVSTNVPLSYQWYSSATGNYNDGVLLDGETNDYYLIPGDLAPGTYYYYCMMEAEDVNAVVSDAAMVIVEAAPAPADYTLYYDSADGKMYTTRSTSTPYTYSNEVNNTDLPGWSAAQVGSTGAYVLTLNGFDFSTTAAVALDLITTTTIELVGDNHVASATSGTNLLATGILARGLTVQEDGSLSIEAGISTDSASYGIDSHGALTITSGTIIAESSESGFSSGIMMNSGNLTVSGGTVNSVGGTSSFSYGIYASSNNINITGGTVTAQGKTSALNKAPSALPTSYTADFSNNFDGSDRTEGAASYAYNASHKYVKIITPAGPATPTAAISGTPSLTALTAETATFTLATTGITAGTAFTVSGLPAGVTQTTTVTTGDSTTVTLTGTATTAYVATSALTVAVTGMTSNATGAVNLTMSKKQAAAFTLNTPSGTFTTFDITTEDLGTLTTGNLTIYFGATLVTATSVGAYGSGKYVVTIPSQTGNGARVLSVTIIGTLANHLPHATSVTVTPTSQAKEATPAAAIDYAAEKLTGLTASAVYIIGSTEYTADANGKIDIASSWFNTSIGIVKKGITATPTLDSDAQTLAVPARPAAPSPGKTDTTGGSSNGSITGVDATMEYKLSSASSWTACPGTSVTGLAAGTYNVRVKAVASTSFASTAASITVAGSSAPPSDPDPTPTPAPTPTPTPAPTPSPTPAPPTSNVIVDGQEIDAGEVEVKEDTTTVTVNQDVINKQLETASDHVTVIVPAVTGTAVAQLVVQNVDDMATKDMTLTIQVGNVQYEIPTTAMDTTAILAALGADNAADVPIGISITTDVSAATQNLVNSAIKTNGNTLVIPPMEFAITAAYEGKTMEIDTFSRYISRSVEITAEQAARITTALVVNPDGTTRHVPTRVYEQEGKHYAEVNSRTNSTYAFVYNEKTFTDAKDKWYEAAVSEMAGRMVINGIGDNLFAGDSHIKRAEFAAIIVRALGLPANGDGTVFADVPAAEWFSGAVGTAYAYGIVTGIGEDQFAPNAYITRQEAMLMMQRAAKLTGFHGSNGSIDIFPDADGVAFWALDAAQWNVGSGLIEGSDGKLGPANNITRAETATLVLKLMQKAGLVDVRTGF